MKRTMIALLLVAPLMAQAGEAQHQFEVQGEAGWVQELGGESVNDDLAFQGYLGYEYQLNENYAFGIDYLAGDSFDVGALLALADGSMDYSAWELTARATTWVSQRNSLYATLRVLHYGVDVMDEKGEELFDDSGLGGGISLGWRYQFDMGLGLGVSATYRKLGSDTEVSSFGYNLSYRF
ncbi:porin family protein [Ferrimonas sediminicola]|uniref:Porin family protein n=1 Tax=Ferrimonas sediminicola TaxID=2569538 RepID=A0A4U1BF18_9GAMM|nr:outer membrane beta-barrel protein [Ferrimonas sediminicola]TKB49808.1 porin family protein [Ferrimonas sediminicola]